MAEEQPLLPPGTIQHLQEYIAAKIQSRGFADETLHERLLLLTEEVGELVKACRKISGMYVDQAKTNDAHIGQEIADVLTMVFCVAIELGIDVEKEFLEKQIEIDKRIYKRTNA